MAYTDFIAAIDLGTSHMVGMVGTKNATGALSIIAYEVENSGTCIRRGCVYNVKETASKIKRLILKLENKLGGTKIGQVYVGLGWPVTPFYRAYGLQGIGNGRSGHGGDHRLSLSRVLGLSSGYVDRS